MAPSMSMHPTIETDIVNLDYGSIILLNLDVFQSDGQHMLSFLPTGTQSCECLVIDTLKPDSSSSSSAGGTSPPSIQVIPLMPESTLLRSSGQFPYMTTLIDGDGGDGSLLTRWYSTKKYSVEPSAYGPKVKQLYEMKIPEDQLKKIFGNPS